MIDSWDRKGQEGLGNQGQTDRKREQTPKLNKEPDKLTLMECLGIREQKRKGKRDKFVLDLKR